MPNGKLYYCIDCGTTHLRDNQRSGQGCNNDMSEASDGDSAHDDGNQVGDAQVEYLMDCAGVPAAA